MSAFLKNLSVKVLGGRWISVWGPLLSHDPILPPPYTLYTCVQYTYSHRELTPVENLLPLSLTPGCTLICEYLREFSKKFEMTPMLFFRVLGEGDSWKKPEVENLVTLSL